MVTMATETRRLPVTGRPVEGVPSDWTEADLMIYLRENNPEAFSQELSGEAARTAAANRELPVPTRLERFAKGPSDIYKGVEQLIDMRPPWVREESDAEYAEGQRLFNQALGNPIIEPWSLAGMAAASAPAALLGSGAGMGTAGTLAVAGGTGGLLGALPFAETPGQRMVNAGMGAAGGIGGAYVFPWMAAGANAAQRAVRRGVSNLRRRPTVSVTVDDIAARTGRPAEEVTDAARSGYQRFVENAYRTGDDLDAEAALRRAEMEAQGFVDESAPMRGQVTRDPTQFGDESNLAVQGERAILDRRLAQYQQAENRLAELRRQFGVDVESDITEQAGEAVGEQVRRVAGAWQDDVRELYRRAAEQRPGARIKSSALDSRLESTFRDFRNVIPPDIRARLAEFRKAGGASPQDLEQLDQLASKFYGQNDAIDEVVRRVKTAAREAMTTLDDDFGTAWRDAVGEAHRRFKAMEIPGGRESTTEKFLREAMDPNKLVSTLRSGSPRDIRVLRDFVAREGDPAPWREARTALWNNFVEESMPQGSFNQATFNRQLRRMGDARGRAVFGDDGWNEIREFGRVTRNLFGEPALSSRNFSNTTNTAIGLAKRIGDRLGIPAVDWLMGAIERLGEGARRRQQVRVSLDAPVSTPRPPAQVPPIQMGPLRLGGAPAYQGYVLPTARTVGTVTGATAPAAVIDARRRRAGPR